MNKHTLERLAALEHEQWMKWSKAVSGEVSVERMARWTKLWVPYSFLTEEQKEQDREYARKVMEALDIPYENQAV